jgi:glucose-6-phosphate isomerase
LYKVIINNKFFGGFMIPFTQHIHFDFERNDLFQKSIHCFDQLKQNKLRLFDLPGATDEYAGVIDHLRAFKDIIIFGTGGSSLGGQTLAALSTNEHPRLHFMDNIDPFTFDQLIHKIDLVHTGIIVVSKSGETAETLIQFLLILEEAKKHLSESQLKEHFLVITEDKESTIRQLAMKYNLLCTNHDQEIGGRYSVLSNVGLIPAKLLGLDIQAMRAGAQAIVHQMTTANNIEDISPVMGAFAQLYSAQHMNTTQSVLMPYIDRLEPFSRWYMQLWAESLGKQGKGTTPLRAIGAVDQHSQLQLYLDGPKDKLFTMILLEQQGKGARVTKVFDELVGTHIYLNKTIGDLFEVEQRATLETLKQNGLPVRSFAMKQLNEYTMGALLMHFMVETILAGHMLDINPFDQPAVEQGKVLAREYLTQ